MNTVESCIITSPYGKDEECAKIIVDDTADPFIFHGIASVGQTYTFTVWIKSDAEGNVSFTEASFTSTSDWTKHVATFTAANVNLPMYFAVVGTYYMYHPQLEIGTVSTDWSPSPDDMDAGIENAQTTADSATERLTEAESTLRMLADSISMLVTDSNGTSLMTQTADGWTFSTAAIQSSVDAISENLGALTDEMGSVGAAVEALNTAVDDLGVIAEYIKIGTHTYTDLEGVEQTVPSIELGETDSDFKLRITNQAIVFLHGPDVLVSIDSETKSLNIEKAEIGNELRLGGFVWKIRANGNMGLLWKGATS